VGKSATGDTISAHVRKTVIAEIQARAEALSWKKGSFAARILEDWFDRGAPAVTPADQAMQDLKTLRAAGTPQQQKPKKTA
jgi:hypothetical protein